MLENAPLSNWPKLACLDTPVPRLCLPSRSHRAVSPLLRDSIRLFGLHLVLSKVWCQVVLAELGATIPILDFSPIIAGHLCSERVNLGIRGKVRMHSTILFTRVVPGKLEA